MKNVVLPPDQTKFKYQSLLIKVVFLLIFILVIELIFYFYSTFNQTKPYVVPTAKIEPTIFQVTPEVTSESEKPNMTIGTGFSFYLPKSWTAKISSQSKQHFYGKFFIPDVNEDNSFIEIESIANSLLIKNPFITFEKTEQKKINGLSVVISEGKESFQKSDRLVKQATFESKGNTLIITLYRKPADQIIDEFENLIQSVSSSNQQTNSGFIFVSSVSASESIAGKSIDSFVKTEVMGDPLPERITKNDAVYKEGFAKFYKFEAFKGQRLTAVAMEDTAEGSFIRSELYDDQGQRLFQMDTRIEFTTTYTGTYYYIVHSSFNNQEGGYLMKIFDRDQTENLTYIKYEDGSEKFIDSNISPPVYGEKDVAIIIQFVNPIEVIDNQSVRYFAKPLEFESGLGLITSPIKLYIKKENYSQFLETPGNQLPENNEKYLIKTKITKLSPSKVIIEQEDGGLFSKGNHISMTEQKKGITRFFLENPSK